MSNIKKNTFVVVYNQDRKVLVIDASDQKQMWRLLSGDNSGILNWMLNDLTTSFNFGVDKLSFTLIETSHSQTYIQKKLAETDDFESYLAELENV